MITIRNSFGAVIFLFILNSYSLGQVTCSSPITDLRKAVRDSIGQNNKNGALVLGRCLVEREPGLDSNYILLSIAYLCDSIRERNSHADTLAAIQNFEQSLSINNNYFILNGLGKIFFDFGRYPYDSAIFYYTHSVRTNNSQDIGYEGLSRTYESIGDTSYKTCSDLISIFDSISVREELKRRQILFKDADLIHQDLLKARASFNEHVNKLSSYYDSAIIAMDSCIARKPGDITYRRRRVALILKINEFKTTQDYSPSIADLRVIATQTDPELAANADYFLGSIFEKEKKYDSAIANYRKAVTVDKDKTIYWEALLKSVKTRCKIDKICSPEDEEYALSNLIRLDPKQAAYYFRLGYLYDSLGFSAKKIALYKNAAYQMGSAQDYFSEWLQNYTAIKPEIDSLENYLSSYPINRKKYEPLPANYFQALHILGVDYFKIDNFIKSGYIIERLITFFPKDDSLKVILASIYLRKDLMRNSLKMARKAKRQGKTFLEYKVLAYNLESKKSNMRSRWRYKKAIKRINSLIAQGQSENYSADSGTTVEDLQEQKRKIYQQISENFYRRGKYRRGKKFCDLANQ